MIIGAFPSENEYAVVSDPTTIDEKSVAILSMIVSQVSLILGLVPLT